MGSSQYSQREDPQHKYISLKVHHSPCHCSIITLLDTEFMSWPLSRTAIDLLSAIFIFRIGHTLFTQAK